MIETAKLIINSTLSTRGAKFIAIDIGNFYIQNNLEYFQYIRFAMDRIPQETIDAYNLEEILHTNGYCYAKIHKAMYGLREAGYILNVELKGVLRLANYVLSKYTPGLFTHKTRDIAFSLVVDDFGVRYGKIEDTEHLLKTIKDRYPVRAEWSPTFYLGVTLDFDYEDLTCKMSMPGYMKQALIRFHHEFSKITHSPSPFNVLVYGHKIQMTPLDKTNLMTTEQINYYNKCGTFLYYERVVNCTMLHALNDLAIRTKDGTQKTVKSTQ